MNAKVVNEAGLLARLQEVPETVRTVVAIAGAPGSGKSTLAEGMVDGLNNARPGRAALLPMDGYHFDDGLLMQMGRLSHKGAPDTFDVGGLAHVIGRLRANSEDTVAVPVFDRDIEIARAGARLIPRSASILIVEGNYLLVRDTPWQSLRPLFDVTVMIDVPEAELRRRLTARWNGYGLSDADLAHKLDANDLPNGRTVRDRSAAADLILRQA